MKYVIADMVADRKTVTPHGCATPRMFAMKAPIAPRIVMTSALLRLESIVIGRDMISPQITEGVNAAPADAAFPRLGATKFEYR
jgi:hypothetical protein